MDVWSEGIEVVAPKDEENSDIEDGEEGTPRGLIYPKTTGDESGGPING